MKSISNDDFFTNWMPIHKKGMVAYVIKFIWPTVIFPIIVASFFVLINRPIEGENLHYYVYFCIITMLLNIIVISFRWVSSEKLYKYIEQVRQDAIKERQEIECK